MLNEAALAIIHLMFAIKDLNHRHVTAFSHTMHGQELHAVRQTI